MPDDELLRRVAEDVLDEEIGEVPGHPPYVDTAAGNYPLDYYVTTDAILDALEERWESVAVVLGKGRDGYWVKVRMRDYAPIPEDRKVKITTETYDTRLEALCRAALDAVEEA